MVTIASNFSALWVVAVWWLLLVSALASVFTSVRGHWSGPLLAAPAILCNMMLDHSGVVGHGTGNFTTGNWFTFLAPSIIGLLALGVWIWSCWRHSRNRPGA